MTMRRRAFENMVGKGENAGKQCFLSIVFLGIFKFLTANVSESNNL